MKIKLMKLWQKFIRTPIPILCYSIIIVAWLLSCCFSLIADNISRRNGSLSTQTFTTEDFLLEDFKLLKDGSLQSLSDDPKMIFRKFEGKVRTLRFKAIYKGLPHEIDLFYNTSLERPFGKDMRVWPIIQDDGSYMFTLPRKNIKALRLDPTSTLTHISFEEIVMNEPIPSLQYFNPGFSGLALLLILPAFAAAMLRWLCDTVKHYTATNKKQTNTK